MIQNKCNVIDTHQSLNFKHGSPRERASCQSHYIISTNVTTTSWRFSSPWQLLSHWTCILGGEKLRQNRGGVIESPPISIGAWATSHFSKKCHQNQFITFGDISFTRNDYTQRDGQPEGHRDTSVHGHSRSSMSIPLLPVSNRKLTYDFLLVHVITTIH